jgi:hypothetical protein
LMSSTDSLKSNFLLSRNRFKSSNMQLSKDRIL